MNFDLRLPIGILFSIFGVILTSYGFITKGSEMYEKSLGKNINIIWGSFLLVFGLTMLALAKFGKKKLIRWPCSGESAKLRRVKLSVYTGGFVQTNGYLVETPDGNFLIDAPEGVTRWIASKGVRIDDVLLTHQHYDHVTDCAALKAGGAKLHALEDFSKDLTLENAARAWGLPISVIPYEIDSKFELGAPLKIAGQEIRLEHVPGHSTDSVTFYLPDRGVLFSGDTLFAESVGRSDLPGGNTKQLLDGIIGKLLVLPSETQVFPGHGPSTTIGAEASGNPYLA